MSAFVHYRDTEMCGLYTQKDKIQLELRSEWSDALVEMFANTKGQNTQNIQRQNTGRDLNNQMVWCTSRTATS